MTSPSQEVKPLTKEERETLAAVATETIAMELQPAFGEIIDAADVAEARWRLRYEATIRELESRVSPGAAPAPMFDTEDVRIVAVPDVPLSEEQIERLERARKAASTRDQHPAASPDNSLLPTTGMTATRDLETLLTSISQGGHAYHMRLLAEEVQRLRASRSSGEDQTAATDEIAALKRRAEAAEEDWQIAEIEVASLKQQVIDSALRAERLEADRTALIEGKVWKANTYEPSTEGWRHSTKVKDGPSPLYATADEALAAYRASLSPQPAPEDRT